MQVKKHVGMSGRVVMFYIPENDEDHALLRKMEQEGRASSKASFGDWKNQKKGPRKG
jgi:hypothetical protein